VRIRDATVEDAPAIARLQLDSWQDAYRGLLPDDYLDSLDEEEWAALWQRTLDGLGDRAAVLAAEEDGNVVGFVHSGPGDDPREGRVFAMHVTPRLRSRGIGFDLHDLALRRLRHHGYRDVDLWLLNGNVRARHFYERQGWRSSGDERAGTWPTGALETRFVRAL
jgi:ribosomal protein S18 acetylase RimI-like enzyme